MIRIGFCDDDLSVLNELQVLLDQYRVERNHEIDYTAFHSPLDLLAEIERGVRFDILFLDVLMPGENGIDAAAEIRNYDSDVKIIFLTSSPEFAVQSYTVGAYFYQLKPIWAEGFYRLMDSVLATCEKEQASSLILRCKSGITRVDLKQLEYHSAKEQTENQLQQVQKSLNLQLTQAVREINALRESQTMASQYRHDLRHHLQYLSACIENGQTEQAQSYISGICEEIEAQKVQRYCENEAANLILSSFAGRAQKDGVAMHVQGALPAFILVSDSDLCVLLSNALENALHACRPFVAAGTAPVIEVRFYVREDKLFLQVTNPCGSEIRFENGLPVSDQPGHGIGVQSICAIVRRYGGVYAFSVQNGQFILRLSL